MRRWLLIPFLLMACCAQAKQIALLIAVGNYANPALTLSGPPHDLAAMRDVLQQRWQFQPADIHTLLNGQATRANILAELRQLRQRSAPGDLVLIYYSGHGTSALDPELALPLPDSTGAWAPFDVRLDAGPQAMIDSLIVGRTALRPVLEQLDRDRDVLVLSDSCFSGNVVRGGGRKTLGDVRMLPAERGASSSPPMQRGPRPEPPPYPYHRVVMLSAASDREAAKDINEEALQAGIRTVDGKPHGTFTDGLLRVLQGELTSKGPLDYTAVHQLLKANMARYGELGNHEPQLLPGLADGGQLVVAKPFMHADTAAAWSAASAAPAPGPLRVRLEGAAVALSATLAQIDGVVLAAGVADLVVGGAAGAYTLGNGRGDMVRSTPGSERAVLDRIRAEAGWRRILQAASAQLGLRAEVAPATRGGTFIAGEQLRFAATLERGATLLLVNLDSDGQFTLLYPGGPQEMAAQQAGARIMVPALSEPAIRSSEPYGLDLVGVLAFAQPPPGLRGWLGGQPGPLQGATMRALAAAIAAAPGQVQAQLLELRSVP